MKLTLPTKAGAEASAKGFKELANIAENHQIIGSIYAIIRPDGSLEFGTLGVAKKNRDRALAAAVHLLDALK